jgi:GNAT superfamily N-acetyltransferase
VIRSAQPSDVPVLLELVRELAVYEREPDAVIATESDLDDALFGKDPSAGCQVATVDGAVVGFALWYRTFSTWKGKPGLWLEDLFVRPEHRGSGLGKDLLVSLAEICVGHGWSRFEWWVLDSLEVQGGPDGHPGPQGFYRSIGAHPEDAWTVWRLDDAELLALARNERLSR